MFLFPLILVRGVFLQVRLLHSAGDPNQYVVAATSNLITLAAPGLRQDLADDTAIADCCSSGKYGV